LARAAHHRRRDVPVRPQLGEPSAIQPLQQLRHHVAVDLQCQFAWRVLIARMPRKAVGEWHDTI
jgi:hypothetical protein